MYFGTEAVVKINSCDCTPRLSSHHLYPWHGYAIQYVRSTSPTPDAGKAGAARRDRAQRCVRTRARAPRTALRLARRASRRPQAAACVRRGKQSVDQPNTRAGDSARRSASPARHVGTHGRLAAASYSISPPPRRVAIHPQSIPHPVVPRALSLPARSANPREN